MKDCSLTSYLLTCTILYTYEAEEHHNMHAFVVAIVLFTEIFMNIYFKKLLVHVCYDITNSNAHSSQFNIQFINLYIIQICPNHAQTSYRRIKYWIHISSFVVQILNQLIIAVCYDIVMPKQQNLTACIKAKFTK
jgi:hypothetical protein